MRLAALLAALVAVTLTSAPAHAQTTGDFIQAPWFSQLNETNQEALQQLEQRRQAIEHEDWMPAFTMQLNSQGQRTLNPSGCGYENRGEIDIHFENPGRPPWTRWSRYRGAAVGCMPRGSGVIDYVDGRQWIGETALLLPGDNFFRRVPEPSGAGMLRLTDGRFVVGTFSIARTGPTLAEWGGQLRRSEIDTPFRADEPRELGANGQVVYHFANGGSLGATIDNGQLIGDGALTRDGIRITGALHPSAGAFFAPFNVERAPERPSDAIGFTMARRVETSVDSSIGPAGAYLMSGPLAFNELPAPDEVRPEPGTLARYAPQAQSCAYRPAIPPGWLYWGPDCAARPDRIDAWAVNGAHRLRFARIDGRDLSVLQEMDPEQPGRVRAEWRGAPFDMSGPVPAPQGNAELWRDGQLAFSGPFAGLAPQGDGFCGRTEAEGGGAEPCTFAGGQRADALHLARVEQERLDAQFAARAAEAQRIRTTREQERIQAQREEARRIAQQAADRRAAQRAQNDAFWGAVAQGLAASSLGAPAYQAPRANISTSNAASSSDTDILELREEHPVFYTPPEPSVDAPAPPPPPPVVTPRTQEPSTCVPNDGVICVMTY